MWLWESSIPNWIIGLYLLVSGFVLWQQQREIARLDKNK